MSQHSNKHAVFAALGRIGGLSRSPAKLAAVAANARKGGRPKGIHTPLRRHPSPPVRKIGHDLAYFQATAWKRLTDGK